MKISNPSTVNDGSVTSKKLALSHIFTTLAASVVLVASTNTVIFSVTGVNGRRYCVNGFITIQCATGAHNVDMWIEQSGVQIMGNRISLGVASTYSIMPICGVVVSDGSPITLVCLATNTDVVFGGASLGRGEGSRFDLLDLG
jgi:hypothetical protein